MWYKNGKTLKKVNYQYFVFLPFLIDFVRIQ